MQPPDFWYPEPSATQPQPWSGAMLETCLRPVAAAYAYFGRRRIKRTTAAHASVPVICIGNLTLGGTGKTPTAIAVAEIITGWGLKPVFLTRGYGGTVKGPLKVDTQDAADIGDETALLSTHATTIVSRDRPAGATLAVRTGADVIIMDDGFQNPTLHKDFSIVVVDGGVMFGNERVFPAGPLREPVSAGLSRAQAVLIVNPSNTTPPLPVSFTGQVLMARIKPKANPNISGRCIAFAGIGRPDKFFATLRELNTDVVATHAFPDHYPYAPQQIETLLAQAAAQNARVITTAKDAVRLLPEHRQKIEILDIDIVFDNEQNLRDQIRKMIDAFSRQNQKDPGSPSTSAESVH